MHATVIARALHGAIEGVERQVLQRLREDELSRIHGSSVPASRAGTATAIARWPLNDLAGSTLSSFPRMLGSRWLEALGRTALGSRLGLHCSALYQTN